MQNKDKKYSGEYIRYIQQIALMCDTVSLNTKINTEEGDETELGDFIQDTEPTPEELVAEQDKHDLIMRYLAKYLTPREEKVIRLRFGLDDGQPRTLEEVGEIYGITRERIRQVEAKAIRKLRCAFARNKIKRENL